MVDCLLFIARFYFNSTQLPQVTMGISKRRRRKIKRRVRNLVGKHRLNVWGNSWSRGHHWRASRLKAAIKSGQPSWFNRWSPSSSYRLCQRAIARKYKEVNGIYTAPVGRPLSAITALHERYVSKVTKTHPEWSINQVKDRLLSRVRTISGLVYLY